MDMLMMGKGREEVRMIFIAMIKGLRLNSVFFLLTFFVGELLFAQEIQP